jgi:hypothetical protein
MRIGTVQKQRRGEKKYPRADAEGKPKNAAAASIVGQLSPDIISTYFAPKLNEAASEALERYAGELLDYDDLIRDIEKLKAEEAEINADGTIYDAGEPPVAPETPLFRSKLLVAELEKLLNDTSNHFHSKKGGWKIHARAARFERLMDEKYGIFRPFLKEHPEVERFARSTQVKYANGYFSPIRQGPSPIPKSTAVIILFMMKRGDIRWEILTLSALFFLVGLQPWALVALVAVGHTLLEGRKKRCIKPMKKFIPTTKPFYQTQDDNDENISKEEKIKKKTDKLLSPVGAKLGSGENIDMSKYDTMILGAGPDALYTAALLSRAGRKVVVLTSKEDASGCYTITNTDGKSNIFDNVPFDLASSNISKISGQQELLAPALSNSTDYQGGIRFAQIGSDADGYAFEILSVPGMGSEGSTGPQIPFVLRATGTPAVMEDAAMSLGDGWPDNNGGIGNSMTGVYATTCESINSSSANFYLSKILPENINGMRKGGTYQEVASRYASAFLDKGFSFNAHARSLFAAIGMTGENIKSSNTSMAAHVTNISAALSGEGMHYPIGGPRALCHALAAVVEQSGGSIFSNVPVSELIFEADKAPTKPKPTEIDENQTEPSPRCIGVKLADGRELKLDMSNGSKNNYTPAVISMHGFVTTFIRLLSDDVRTKHKVPRGLPALSESRPVFKLLFALEGSAKNLDLTGADFYRLPGAALAQDEFDSISNQLKLGEIGWVDENSEEKLNVDDINKDPADNPQGSDIPTLLLSKPTKKKRTKFDTGVSWVHISFPSAKDPSFESRHGDITTCVVTVEADDDFVTFFDTKPKLYSIHRNKGESSGEYQRLVERIKKDLLEAYPQLEGKNGICLNISFSFRSFSSLTISSLIFRENCHL